MTDRLPPEDFADLAATVPLGQRRRFPHACGPGNTLLVSRGLDGARRAYCFRCDASGWTPALAPSMAELLAARHAAAVADAEVQRAGDVLPQPLLLADRLADWPMPARLWLARAGLGAFEIARLGAGYHPPSNRVVLPVYGPAGLVYWQARSIDGRQPKYLGASTGKDRAVPRWGNDRTVVLTEDILSAYKVGLSGGEGWSCLGVKPNSALLSLLLASGKPVLVWLDPDKAGQDGAAKIRRVLNAYDIPNTNVVSTADPKLLQRSEIRATISDRLEGR